MKIALWGFNVTEALHLMDAAQELGLKVVADIAPGPNFNLRREETPFLIVCELSRDTGYPPSCVQRILAETRGGFVAVVTAYPEHPDAIATLKSGAFVLLTKPHLFSGNEGGAKTLLREIIQALTDELAKRGMRVS